MIEYRMANAQELAGDFLNAYFIEESSDGLGGSRLPYTLRSWQDGFYKYKDGFYAEISKIEMQILIGKYIDDFNDGLPGGPVVKITRNRVKDILFCVQTKVHVPETVEINSWLDGPVDSKLATIAFKNGLLNIDTNDTSTDFVDHTPDYFTLSRLPYDYDKSAKCSKWLQFLNDVMESDEERIKLLQQWAGYILTPNLRQQKFLLCAGEGANGKGVFFETIERMVGRENCSHIQLARFGGQFDLSSTLGKMINASTESSRNIETVAETMLKAYTSGDPITFERKYRDPVDTVPTAKVMIATNELPRFQDRSEGVWRRMLFVPFDKTYSEEQQQRNLADELALELPGVLNWALEGMKQLQKKGNFVKPAKCVEAIDVYKEEMNPARTFLLEEYAENPSSKGTPTKTVYEQYKNWCEERGYKPLNDANFGKEVRRTFSNVKKERPTVSGKKTNMYAGLLSQNN